jgi:hypothetical protein
MIFIQVHLQLAMSLASMDIDTVTPISHSLSRRSNCHPATARINSQNQRHLQTVSQSFSSCKPYPRSLINWLNAHRDVTVQTQTLPPQQAKARGPNVLAVGSERLFPLGGRRDRCMHVPVLASAPTCRQCLLRTARH